MTELDRIISAAVAEHDAPFLVAMVGNGDGVTWSGTAGESASGQAAALDAVFRLFSMTKSVGSTAAMILMERGKLSPDATVESILPEFADLKRRYLSHSEWLTPCSKLHRTSNRGWPE